MNSDRAERSMNEVQRSSKTEKVLGPGFGFAALRDQDDFK